MVEAMIGRNFELMRDNGPEWIAHTPMFKPRKYDDWLGDAEVSGSYEENLPQINGKTVVEYIDGRVKKLRQREKLLMLDVGCWTADALAECSETERWAGKLNLVGITAQIPDWKKRELDERNIRIEVADAHFLMQVFDSEKFDLVISNGAVGCMTDQVKVLSQIWEILSDNGVALISGAYWPVDRTNQLKDLNKFLKKSGYKIMLEPIKWATMTNRETGEVFSYLHVVMEKNTNKPLQLPLTPLKELRKFRSDCPGILVYDINDINARTKVR